MIFSSLLLRQAHCRFIFSFLVTVEDIGTPTADVIKKDLQVQNANLRHVIHQIREDMEDLMKQLSQRTTGSITNTKEGVPITEGNDDYQARKIFHNKKTLV